MNKLELYAELARKGMSAAELGRRLKVAPSTISRKMLGHADFTLSEIQQIIEILELDDQAVKNIFFNKKLSQAQQ